jgi:hypothetical protein
VLSGVYESRFFTEAMASLSHQALYIPGSQSIFNFMGYRRKKFRPNFINIRDKTLSCQGFVKDKI